MIFSNAKSKQNRSLRSFCPDTATNDNEFSFSLVFFLLSLGLASLWSPAAPAMTVDAIEAPYIQIVLEDDQAKQLFEVLQQHVDQNPSRHSKAAESVGFNTGAIRCTHYLSADAISREGTQYRCYIATNTAERYTFPHPIWFGGGN